jgi:hypothetical protein
MSARRVSPRLQTVLHSLATRVPNIVLCRAEAVEVFPALHTSMVTFFNHVYCKDILFLHRC